MAIGYVVVLIAFAAGLLSLFTKPIRGNSTVPFLRRVTPFGWMALALLFVSMVAGILTTWQSDQSAARNEKQAEERHRALEEQLSDANQSLGLAKAQNVELQSLVTKSAVINLLLAMDKQTSRANVEILAPLALAAGPRLIPPTSNASTMPVGRRADFRPILFGEAWNPDVKGTMLRVNLLKGRWRINWYLDLRTEDKDGAVQLYDKSDPNNPFTQGVPDLVTGLPTPTLGGFARKFGDAYYRCLYLSMTSGSELSVARWYRSHALNDVVAEASIVAETADDTLRLQKVAQYWKPAEQVQGFLSISLGDYTGVAVVVPLQPRVLLDVSPTDSRVRIQWIVSGSPTLQTETSQISE